MATLDREDIQGIVAWGYGNLRAACFLLLAFDDPSAARAWLASQLDAVTTAGARPAQDALNIAFTSAGLRRLGLAPQVLAMFSGEFVEGMCTPHRSRILGDVDEGAPEGWRWGGPGTSPVDLLVMLYAADEARLAERYSACAATLADGGLRELEKLDTVDLGFREHFGFRDGIAQPAIDGLGRPGRPMDTIRAGEFLLGYPNEYGQYTNRPVFSRAADPERILSDDPEDGRKADLGRNGSYLVFRQLRQDVRGFWRFLDQAARQRNSGADVDARTRLAAKMVGRWPSGAPLVRAPDRDAPDLAAFNDFGYHEADQHGFACPIGAHVRRTNPRDSLDPEPGTEASIAVNRRHRILRRGRGYGPPLAVEAALGVPDVATAEPERGLHFICLNANISRQFEFIQHTWANNPKFAGLYDDADPLVGRHGQYGGTFTVQGQPVRERLTGLPPFVSVRGGAYFFLPGVRALRYLARVGL